MKVSMTGLMMKFFKIITFVVFIFPISIAFGAVSGFVDSKQVTQNLPMAVAFNPSGTKMFVVGMTQNKIFEFDLTTGFDVSTASKNSNECLFSSQATDVVDIDFNSDEYRESRIDIGKQILTIRNERQKNSKKINKTSEE